MADVLARIEESLGVTKEQSIRARTNCLLLSADNGHATHPNHPEKSDQKLPVNMGGGGVLLKYQCPPDLHHQRPYRCRLSPPSAKRPGVPVQTVQPCRDVPGGTTLGNLLGHQILMPMVDIGLGPAGHALGHGDGQLQGCRVSWPMPAAAYYNTPIFQPEDGQWKLGL